MQYSKYPELMREAPAWVTVCHRTVSCLTIFRLIGTTTMKNAPAVSGPGRFGVG
jgi:hypothetical protein